MSAINLALEDIQALLPIRQIDVHKGNLGKVMIIAGSRGMTGAAVLSSRSILRSGAGLATLFTPNFFSDLLDIKNIEIMTMPLATTSSGSINKSAINQIIPIIKKYDTLLLGPGLSANKSTVHFCRDLLEYITHEYPQLRTVVDADGLKALKQMVRPFKKPIIITPHFGELAALLNRTIREIKEDPIFFARKIADKFNLIVILKSNLTYIVQPNSKNYFVNSNGNPGMATAGSGDVLAGICTGLWASNNISAIKAAIAAPFIHGLAGNLAAEKRSIDGIIASDIMEEIPHALKIIKGF